MPFKQITKEIGEVIGFNSVILSAIGVSLVEANELLTFVSLGLAIAFTIYKFIKFEINKDA